MQHDLFWQSSDTLQIYNHAINTVMVAKLTQANEKLDDVIKWAERELESTLRA